MARGKKIEKILTQEEKLQEALVPESEQPYKVPGDWRWTTLSVVCEDFIVPQRDKPKVFDGDIPWCRIEDIEGKYLNGSLSNQRVSEKTIVDMNLRVCPVGTVICSCSASLGVQAILTAECCTNQTFIGLVCSSVLNNNYLYYYLRSLEQYWHQIGTGTTIKYISRKKFELLRTPLPPLPEQQRIVDRIESLFAKLDEAKEKAQAVVDGFEDRKAAILHKAFTGEYTKEWRMQHNISIEDTWEEKTMVDLCSVIVDCPHSTPEWTESGKICLRTTNIKGGYLDLSELRYVSERTYLERVQRAIPQAGDVLLTREGNIGDIGVVPEGIEICLGQRMMLLRPNECEPNFLVYFFRSPYVTAIIRSNTMGSTAPRMNIKALKQISMYCPSCEEQKVITRFLDRLIQLEQHAKESAEQVIAQIDTMKKSILARAFRGELGTNDPSDESAEELLKRIL